MLAVFGLLLSTAAVQRIRSAPRLEAERAELVARIESRSARVGELRDEVRALDRDVERLEEAGLAAARVADILH